MAQMIPDRPTPRAIETATAQQARRAALASLLKQDGPKAVDEFLRKPKTAYSSNLNKDVLSQFFKETPERIKRGTELYRAPSYGEVTERLPREVGKEYKPGRIQSAAGSADLQKLGELISGKGASTGGYQSMAPGIMKITAREDLPGLRNINEFLAKSNNPNFTTSDFNQESVLGPKTRYVVEGFTPGGRGTPATWNLGAYANSGLGALNILGFLPMLMQAGRIMQGTETHPLFDTRGDRFRG